MDPSLLDGVEITSVILSYQLVLCLLIRTSYVNYQNLVHFYKQICYFTVGYTVLLVWCSPYVARLSTLMY